MSLFGIYVHHPWCKKRCAYCSFNVYVEINPPFQQWKEHVLKDWRIEQNYFSNRASSVYFGGGTPSLAPPETIGDLLQAFAPAESAEITLELNPGDICIEQLNMLKAYGVNRFSVGIQSFIRRYARLLNRSHTIEDNHHILKQLKHSTPKSWSLDLIFGLPDQTLNELIWDVDQALRHEPPHISLYGLTIEEGTPLQKSVLSGKIKVLDEDRWAEQFNYLMERLEREGYSQYEISNFARPGHRSVHNEHIWKGGFYAGLGPGAHGLRPCGTRTLQHSSWSKWIESDQPKYEPSTPYQRVCDHILTRTRHINGLPLQLIKEHGYEIDPLTIRELQGANWVQCIANHLVLTRLGRSFSDFITLKLIQNTHSLD